MKIAVILGTRPEIIKMAPIIKLMQEKKIKFYIIHSGQHYSYFLDKIFFKQLLLPNPNFKLEVGSKSASQQTALIISRSEKILAKNKPDLVLVQGDTNTVLGGALAAKKLGIKVGHVEAGLRSYDETMPEELNRKLTDHCSDFLFATTKNSKNILINEKIAKNKIFLTGNTIVDSVKQNIKNLDQNNLKLIPDKFFLVSLHRQENVDNPIRFKNIIKSLKLVGKKYKIPIIFPIHPRSKKMARKFKIDLKGIDIIKPVNYLQFLALEKQAMLILTDSGGVQEESCILKVPCITLRDNTERPETVDVGSNMIGTTSPRRIQQCVETMLMKKRNWKNPFGNGKAAENIIKILEQEL